MFRLPAGIFSNLARVTEDYLLVRRPHEPFYLPNLSFHSRQPDCRLQKLPNLMRPRRAQVIRLAALSMESRHIKPSYGVTHIQKSSAGFQVPNFNNRLLHSLLDFHNLSHEIRGRVVRLSRPSRLKQTQIDCRNPIIEKVLVRQQIKTHFADPIWMEWPQRLLFLDGDRRW